MPRAFSASRAMSPDALLLTILVGVAVFVGVGVAVFVGVGVAVFVGVGVAVFVGVGVGVGFEISY